MKEIIGLQDFFPALSIADIYDAEEPVEKVPCRIRVGLRRFTEQMVDPETCRFRYLAESEQGSKYERDLKIPFKMKNGKLFWDAETYLWKRGLNTEPCDQYWYQHEAKRCRSNTVFAEKGGACTLKYHWLDIDIFTVNLYYPGGSMRVCGRPVSQVMFKTVGGADPMDNLLLRHRVRETLHGTAELDVQDFRNVFHTLYSMGLSDLQLISGEKEIWLHRFGSETQLTVDSPEGTWEQTKQDWHYTEEEAVIAALSGNQMHEGSNVNIKTAPEA